MKVGKGGAKKVGRSKKKPSNMAYKAENRRLKNKLRRVLKSSGPAAAEQWAAERGQTAYLSQLRAKK